MIKINYSRGDLSSISAKKEALFPKGLEISVAGISNGVENVSEIHWPKKYLSRKSCVVAGGRRLDRNAKCDSSQREPFQSIHRQLLTPSLC